MIRPGQIDSFYGEIEKLSALYDPRVHTSPAAKKRLDILREKVVSGKLKGHDVVSLGLSDLLLHPAKTLKTMADKGLRTLPVWATVPSGTSGTIVEPKGLLQRRFARLGITPQIGRVHEMAEVGAMQRAGGIVRTPSFTIGRTPIPKRIAQRLQTKEIEPRLMSLSAMLAERIAGKPGKEAVETLGPLVVRSRTLLGRQTGAHADPSVLLEESNFVATALPPEERKKMLKLRNRSGEAKLLKGVGVRYGEEYVPEMGRRWQKVRKRLGGVQYFEHPVTEAAGKLVGRGKGFLSTVRKLIGKLH